MSMTRGQLITYVSSFLERPGDTDFETLLEGRIDQMLFALYDMHDWNWKHKDENLFFIKSALLLCLLSLLWY